MTRRYPLELLVVGGLFSSCSEAGSPTVSVLETAESPNKALVATVFVEKGGGAAGFVRPNVTIHRTGEEYDPKVKLLVDGTYRSLRVRWLSNTQLEVTYADSHLGTRRKKSLMGVTVSYKRR